MKILTLTTRDLTALRTIGAVGIPSILHDHERQNLKALAEVLEFEPEERTTATGVIQLYSKAVVSERNGESFVLLAKELSLSLTQEFGRHGISMNVSFNELTLHRYQISKPGARFGLSPHRDYSRNIHIIAILVLEGSAPYYICRDKEARGSIEIPARQGSLILLRGAGFENLERPLHYVGQVTQERLVLVMRENQGQINPGEIDGGKYG